MSCSIAEIYHIMVLIFDGNSEIVAIYAVCFSLSDLFKAFV